jgi:sugar phosphate isomerase/epimerase
LNWLQLKEALVTAKYGRFLTVELYTYPDRPEEAAQESMDFLGTIFRPPEPAREG